MKNVRRTFAFTFALAVLAASCGGGDGLSGEDAKLADALAANWLAEDEFPAAIDVDCLAEEFVAGVGGADVIAEYGVTADNVGESDFDDNPLEEPHARKAAAGMITCDNFKDEILSLVVAELPEDQASCFKDAVTDKNLETMIAAAFMGPGGEALATGFQADLVTVFSECGVG